MARFILIFLILLPLTEVIIFINMGRWLSVWTILGLIFFTAFAGIFFIRNQGRKVLARAVQHMRMQSPADFEIFEGFCLLGASVLLITPGFLTDCAGFALLLPVLRKGLWQRLTRHFPSRFSEDADILKVRIIEDDFR